MDVTVITQANNSEAHQGAHVQGEDGDEQRLHALQVAVEEDGHEHNLQDRHDNEPDQHCFLFFFQYTYLYMQGKGLHLGDDVRDGGGAHDDAVLVLEKYPRVDPGLRAEQRGLCTSCQVCKRAAKQQDAGRDFHSRR